MNTHLEISCCLLLHYLYLHLHFICTYFPDPLSNLDVDENDGGADGDDDDDDDDNDFFFFFDARPNLGVVSNVATDLGQTITIKSGKSVFSDNIKCLFPKAEEIFNESSPVKNEIVIPNYEDIIKEIKREKFQSN